MPRLSKIGAAALAAFGWSSGTSGVAASYLVVAGGGSGGGNVGGGGGAGGLLTGTTSLNTTLSYTVTVGAGGAGVSGANGGNNGSSSSLGSVVTTVGGGAGSARTGGSNTGGSTGGSGGGGAGGSSGSLAGFAGTSGQGNTGGNGQNSSGFSSGGGGGAGAVGSNGTGSAGGAGGAGVASSISGTSTYYAGGGGGGAYNSGGLAYGAGGIGGGGAAGNPGTSGAANTGGGSGAGGDGTTSQTSGNGGSGIVIISYAGAQQFGGGVVTSVGGNTIHTFTTSGTLSPITSLSASYLVVAGGGGAGGDLSGGGGAGGLLTGSGLTIDSSSTYLVTVGAGGAGNTGSGVGTNGSDSAFSMVTTTAVGGGGGAGDGTAASVGGSGGGGSSQKDPANGTSGQGYAGGNRGGSAGSGSGGGGGAGGVGGNGSSSAGNGGNGGVGVASSISGTSTYYAGGGGGGGDSRIGGSTAGTGGNGGGGNGGRGTTGSAATANTGGGGGGGGQSGGDGAAGGSGIVIISYAGAPQFGGGTVTSVGGNTIHTFTSSGYLSPIVLLNRSLRFRSSASAYLNRTPATASNRRTFTISAWIKRGKISDSNLSWLFGAGNNDETNIYFRDSDILEFRQVTSGSEDWKLSTTQVFRDPAAWYHFVFAFDTTQATASNRIKAYVNGVQITSFSTTSYPAQNNDTYFNNNIAQYFGKRASSSVYYDGYMAEVNFIDGQALTPSSFGSFNAYGSWSPVRYAGSYGTNGFYLPFTNNASTTTLGYDFSPNGNNWTTNNISLTAGSTYDSMTDVPTLTSSTAANYAVMNPLIYSPSAITFSNGNLVTTTTTAGGSSKSAATFGASAGKFYAEATITTYGGELALGVIINTSSNIYTTGVGYDSYDGSKYVNGTNSAYGATYGAGAVIGIALDLDGQTVTFYKNNTSQGTISLPTASSTWIFAHSNGTTTVNVITWNFGQQPFTYTPPSGFVALNTYNL